MRRDAEFFGDDELDLFYIAKRLREALALEEALTAAGLDYYVETDRYRGGVIFPSERVGVFFYVRPASAESAREVVRRQGGRPFSD